MTSKTSYFEPALFLRGLKKTFPVWLAYVVLWVLFLPLSILNRAQWDPKAADIRELILSSAIASVVTTAILALALAWVLFRFLFRTATSYDIAALPVRRESLFCTNLLCGLAIALGTHLLIALITYGASALIGFPNLSACMELVAAAMLSFLGFFGFAVLIAIIVGNAVAMPFAKGFGWGGELNLEYCFEKLFGFGHGQGYPKERVEPEQRNKKILDGVRAATFKPLIQCLKSIDQDLLKGAVAGEKFSELFFASCKDEELAAYVKTLL